MSLSYLEHINFDKNLLSGFLAKYLSNIRLVILLIIVIVLTGVVGYTNLPRRLNPEVNIPIVNVITAIPGASTNDVESLITIPLEQKLENVENVKKITSSSQDNISVITLEFASNTDPKIAEANAEDAIGNIVLPDNAEDPNVSALDFENQAVWSFAIRSKQNDIASLMQFAKQLGKEIEELASVDRVAYSGYEKDEITLKISQESFQKYNISSRDLSIKIREALSTYPGGNVETDLNIFSISIDPTAENIEDLRNIQLKVNNNIVLLKDIVEISQKSVPNQSKSYYANNNLEATQVVIISVYKSKSAKIDIAQKDAEEVVYKQIYQRYGQFQLIEISNVAREITKQFDDLLHEFGSTMVLVFATIFLFLGLRQGLLSLLTVPLTYLSAFFLMNIVGMSINFLSMFSFLLALGLLVDDTIVIVSAMTTYYKTNKFTPFQTGLMVWRDTIAPIWSTTITTIWSFVPLLLASGILGEFIKPIPVVVSLTMISSTAIAVLVTLPLMIVLLKPEIPRRVTILVQILITILIFVGLYYIFGSSIVFPGIALAYLILVGLTVYLKKPLSERSKKIKIFKSNNAKRFFNWLNYANEKGLVGFSKLEKAYYNLSMNILNSKALRRKVVVGIIIYCVIGFALIPAGLVRSEFFPKVSAEQIYVNMEMPAGTKIEQTELEAKKLLDNLRETKGITGVTASTKSSFSDSGGSSSGANKATFTLTLPEESEQKIDSIEIASNLRAKFANYTDSKVSIIELSGGPPAGADLEVTILGEDLDVLAQYAKQLQESLSKEDGVTNVQTSINEGTSTFVFVPDTAKMNALGISSAEIAGLIRTYTSGVELATTTFGQNMAEEIPIMFRIGNNSTLSNLQLLTIEARSGEYQINSLGKFVPITNITEINREDGKRKVSVTASVLPGTSATEKNTALTTYANNLNLPEGYSWKTGGVNEENEESVRSIILAMGAAFTLILVTMVIQFGSYRQAIVVLLIIPLAVSSVFWVFALLGIPLSFPALIGVLSLFGIVVTNSMFIVDKINLNLREKMPFKEAIADAGASRLEPIILTKLCTVFGLLPITLSDPLWRGLGGAIISGLLIASTIMLLFIPAIYYSWFAPKKN